MRVLFIHPNMPGQYKHLAQFMASDPNNHVVFITKPRNISIPGVHKVEYKMTREVGPDVHRYLIGFQRAVLQGQEVWRVCKELKQQGFIPDVICAHPGWGDGLFLKEIFPESALLNYMEFYYRAFGADMHFDPREPVILDDLARIRVKNSTNLLSLETCDWGITPTFWQRKQQPQEFQHRISVLHEGIDTEHIKPRHIPQLALPNGKMITQNDEIITYVCRNFEPYRGFPTVMHALKQISEERPRCQILIVGNDGVSYGKKLEGGKTYKQQMIEELKPDLNRIHFIETLPYEDYLKILQVSQAHIYFTLPFVLSWSMLEAMSAGCLVIGSATPPVEEVIREGENGLLTDFFSSEKLVKRLHEVFDHPTKMAELRVKARQTILDRYDIKQLLPLHKALLEDLAAKQFPPRAAEKIQQFHRHLENA